MVGGRGVARGVKEGRVELISNSGPGKGGELAFFGPKNLFETKEMLKDRGGEYLRGTLSKGRKNKYLYPEYE